MIDYEYLKKLALAVPKDFAAPEAWEEDRRYLDDELAFLDFLKEATPEKILALIAENEALRADADRYRWTSVEGNWVARMFGKWRAHVGEYGVASPTEWYSSREEAIDAAMRKEPKAE